MNCNHCGTQIEENGQFCPNCGMKAGESYNQGYQQGVYMQQPVMVSPEVEKRMTKLLIFCILELACCNQPFGAIALVFAMLAKSALSRGEFATFEKNCKRAKVTLILGVILALLCGFAYFGLIASGIMLETY